MSDYATGRSKGRSRNLRSKDEREKSGDRSRRGLEEGEEEEEEGWRRAEE